MTGRRLVRHPYLWGATFFLIAGAIIGLVVLALATGGDGGGQTASDNPAYPYPVQELADQGRQHLALGEGFDGYNSNPPTSGPHAPAAAPWGVSQAPLPKEVPIHNMEHGGVVVWYNCAGGPHPLDEAACRQLRDNLTAIVTQALAQGKEVLMTPYADMAHRIALTAWQHLDAFDDLDGARVQAFIASFERRFNPENF